MKLSDQVAIIVGGASGMGAATALRFAAEGARVVIADVDEKKLDEVEAKISRAGDAVLTVPTDVTREEQVQKLVQTVLDSFGKIDVLVNTVGTFGFSKTEELSLDEWRRILDINLTGIFLCCREVGKVMIRQKRGKIVNVASTAGLSAVPYSAHYTASKHGVVGLTKELGVEWGKHGVHVNCICPGATATPMLLESTSEEYRDERSERIPLHRFGKPEEQANVLLFLASSDSDYVTGGIICSDGGVAALAPATGTDALAGGT